MGRDACADVGILPRGAGGCWVGLWIPDVSGAILGAAVFGIIGLMLATIINWVVRRGRTAGTGEE